MSTLELVFSITNSTFVTNLEFVMLQNKGPARRRVFRKQVFLKISPLSSVVVLDKRSFFFFFQRSFTGTTWTSEIHTRGWIQYLSRVPQNRKPRRARSKFPVQVRVYPLCMKTAKSCTQIVQRLMVPTCRTTLRT